MAEIIRVGALELRFLASRHETGGSLDMFEMVVPPAARMPVPHFHRDWDESVYGIAGTTRWTVDGRVVDLGPGDSLFIRRGIVHGFTNAGTGPATCLCVLTPGVLGPEYFHEIGAALAADPPAGPAVLGAIMSRHGLIPVAPG